MATKRFITLGAETDLRGTFTHSFCKLDLSREMGEIFQRQVGPKRDDTPEPHLNWIITPVLKNIWLSFPLAEMSWSMHFCQNGILNILCAKSFCPNTILSIEGPGGLLQTHIFFITYEWAWALYYNVLERLCLGQHTLAYWIKVMTNITPVANVLSFSVRNLRTFVIS
jgi:hypothetical protein